MKAFAAVLCLAALACASAQGYGNTYRYQADIAARVNGDIPSTSGTTRVRTEGDTLFYQSILYGASDITAVHIHLVPQPGVPNAGPLVLALTNTSASVGATPLSSVGSAPLVQTGTRNTANLLANPMLPAARAQLAALGVTDNSLQNIGDVDRLLARGLAYSDVHSLTRVSPNRVGSGLFFTITQAGRRLRSLI